MARPWRAVSAERARLQVRAVDAGNAGYAGNVGNAVVGERSSYLDDAAQRAWRDTHAAVKHVSFNWDTVGAMYGQFAFGLEPRGQF